MILYTKDACLVSGSVTSKGGDLSYVGDRGTPKLSFSVQYDARKQADGSWKRSYMNCEIFGSQAKTAPTLEGREMVLCCGRVEDRPWTGRDGEQRVSRTLNVDFISVSGGVSGGGGGRSAEPVGCSAPEDFDTFAESTEEDDGGDLPF